MAFLNKGRSKLTTKPARSVKRITKPKAPVKKPTNVKPNVAGQAAARASLNASRGNFGGEGRATTGKKVTRTNAKPVKSRTSVKVSQRSKKIK
jgi:hypothetical protein